jgi:hypothetical protein
MDNPMNHKGCRLFLERHFIEAESELRVSLGMQPENAEVLNALGTTLDAQNL